MRTLIKCLDSSVSQRVIELEEVALALATGTEASAATTESLPAALGTDGELPSTLHQLTAAPFVDNRNFELLVDSLTTAPGQPILPEAAVRALGAVAVRAAAFVQGAPVPDLPVKMDGLSPTDKAYVEALDGVVRRAVDDADGTTVASSTNVYEGKLAIPKPQLTHSPPRPPPDRNGVYALLDPRNPRPAGAHAGRHFPSCRRPRKAREGQEAAGGARGPSGRPQGRARRAAQRNRKPRPRRAHLHCCVGDCCGVDVAGARGRARGPGYACAPRVRGGYSALAGVKGALGSSL